MTGNYLLGFTGGSFGSGTPSVIYPGRQIGRLKPGYEVSFLVLGCDPLKSFECVDDIRFRFKQGGFIQTEE